MNKETFESKKAANKSFPAASVSHAVTIEATKRGYNKCKFGTNILVTYARKANNKIK